MAVIEDKSAPGTLQLIDAEGELHVKHSGEAHDIVLVPVPSGMIGSLTILGWPTKSHCR